MDELRKKALLGQARFALILALLLFVPAWSVRFWQAWVYWAVVCGSILFITLDLLKHDPALVERRMKAGPKAEQEKSQKVIQSVAAVLVLALCITAGLDHRYQWSSVPLLLVLAGDFATLAGFLLVFRVFKENTFTASTVKVEAEQKVIATGPYALVRHPMYAGTVLLIVATPFALGSLWALVPAILLIGVVAARLLEEERYLRANLAGYGEYCDKVRYRLIPKVW
jgi:protein-S-isoprenylcysteine O-methyltransferase Ste14